MIDNIIQSKNELKVMFHLESSWFPPQALSSIAHRAPESILRPPRKYITLLQSDTIYYYYISRFNIIFTLQSLTSTLIDTYWNI